MRKSWFAAALAAVAIVAALGGARAWWVKGHETITEAAALQLPDEVPAFFRAAGKSLAHFAGNPAHYTTDASMPLHTTRNYDGRPGPDGKMKQRGIHAKVDGYPETNHFTPEEVCRGLQAKKVDDVWDYVVKFIQESHTHIDK